MRIPESQLRLQVRAGHAEDVEATIRDGADSTADLIRARRSEQFCVERAECVLHGDGAGRFIGHSERDVAGLRIAGRGRCAGAAAQLRRTHQIAGKEGRTPRRAGQPVEAVEFDIVSSRLAFVEVELIGPHR